MQQSLWLKFSAGGTNWWYVKVKDLGTFWILYIENSESRCGRGMYFEQIMEVNFVNEIK